MDGTVNPDIDPARQAYWDAAIVQEASGESQKYTKVVGGTSSVLPDSIQPFLLGKASSGSAVWWDL